MKKLLITGLVAALVAGALVAPAAAGKKKAKPRVVEGSYANPALGVPGVAGTSSAGGAIEFGAMANEKYISIEIADTGGASPSFTMSQDSDPTNTTGWEIFYTGCGATEEPVQIAPGLPVRVSVYTTPSREVPTCTGPASSGTITATFTR